MESISEHDFFVAERFATEGLRLSPKRRRRDFRKSADKIASPKKIMQLQTGLENSDVAGPHMSRVEESKAPDAEREPSREKETSPALPSKKMEKPQQDITSVNRTQPVKGKMKPLESSPPSSSTIPSKKRLRLHKGHQQFAACTVTRCALHSTCCCGGATRCCGGTRCCSGTRCCGGTTRCRSRATRCCRTTRCGHALLWLGHMMFFQHFEFWCGPPHMLCTRAFFRL